jgi:hypothetical protein
VTIDDVDRLQMAQLILREREAQEKLDTAKQALSTWVRRGKLAVKAGEVELAREAKKRALEARDEIVAAEAELEQLTGAKRRLRREARRPDERPTTNAEMLVEHFRLQGLAPEDQEMREVVAQAEAELGVEALKGGPPAGPPSQAPGAPPATPRAPAPTSGAPPEDALERELAALRASVDESEPLDEDALAELERVLGEPPRPPDDEG